MFDFLLCDGNKMFGAAFPHPNLSNFPASPTFITWELLWDFCATNPGRICGIHNPRDIQSGRGQSSNLPCCKKTPSKSFLKFYFWFPCLLEGDFWRREIPGSASLLGTEAEIWAENSLGGEESAGKTPGMCPRSLCPFYPFSPAIPGGFLHFLLRIFRDF